MRNLIFWAFVASAFPAFAQEMPRYDVQGHCSGLFGQSQSLQQVCLQTQQQAYNDLKPQWANVPQAVRDHCTSIFDTSYDLLKICVENELQAAGANESFEFEF